MKASPQTITGPAPASAIADHVDELGALEKRLLPYRADLARIEILRKAVRAHYDGEPAALPFEARGAKYVVLLGPRAVERVINPAKLIKAIGLKVYATLAKVTLGALEAGVPADIVAGVVTSGHTGARSLKTFELGDAR